MPQETLFNLSASVKEAVARPMPSRTLARSHYLSRVPRQEWTGSW